MKFSKFLGTALCSSMVLSSTVTCLAAEGGEDVYRLYNKHTGEHFYTASAGERDHLKSVGWTDEGTGWVGAQSGEPVYRVYNPNADGGDHYYTKNHDEASHLVSLGWQWDNGGNAVFYSGGNVPLYVGYNPNAKSGAHNYTTGRAEQDYLMSIGWQHDAVAWNVIAEGTPAEPSQPSQPSTPGMAIAPAGPTARGDENVTGIGGAEANVPGSFRTIYSNKPFDAFPGADTETPSIEYTADVAMASNASDYELQFVIAGNGQGSGQIGLSLHFQAGTDANFAQGRINTTVINFPAGAGTNGEQYYSVNTAAPQIAPNQMVNLKVQYFDSGFMKALVNGTTVGIFRTQLTTPNAYILHVHTANTTSSKLANMKVYRNGQDVTNNGAPSFPTTAADNFPTISGAYY